MNNEFGLINLWASGDGVTRFVALLLLAMSLASWVVILTKTLGLLAARKQALRVDAFWRSADVAGGVKVLGDEAFNPFRSLAESGQQTQGLGQYHHPRGQRHGQQQQRDKTRDAVARGP